MRLPCTTARALIVCVLVVAGARAAEPVPPAYSLDELCFMQGLGGFGDVGRLDVSRDVVSPHSALGFGLKVDWEDHPAEPSWWSVRVDLPGAAAGFDTFHVDLWVDSAESDAFLTLFLVETDDDRWIAWKGRLQDVPPHQWQHIEIRREAMEPWLLGNRTPQWERLGGLAVEPNRGRAVFRLDGARLTTAGTDRRLEIFTAADDGLRPDPAWPPLTVAPVPEPGGVYFPFDGSRLDAEEMLDAPVRLHELLGRVGTPMSGYDANLPRKNGYMTGKGMLAAVHYSPFASGYMRSITRRQGWDVNARGRSLNSIPLFQTTWDGRHSISLAHPAVNEALRRKADALVAAGVGTWMVVDYTFPWWEATWGYSEALATAFRDDLAGRDEGLFLRDGDRQSVLHFPGYLQAYLGFTPTPTEFGLADWDAFAPPRENSGSDLDRRRWTVFLFLRSYEWLKLADRTGRYYQSRGGHGLWVIPNPEDSHGSSDYVFMVRSCGVRNLFPEWFGPIGWAAEAGYASLPYLREQARRSGCRLSDIQESGAGGHSTPYLDWRLAYNGVYALTAAGASDDFDNDFLDDAPYAGMADPKDAYRFGRWRDGVAKALAFRQARAESAARPGTRVLCVGERPPARACGSIFFSVDQPHSLAVGLSRAHVVFDLRDSLELETVLDRYTVVAYSPWAPRPGDLARLRAWLEAEPGRVLITHSFVPTRETTEFWNLDSSSRLGARDGGPTLGLGTIRAGRPGPAVVAASAPGWAEALPVGTRLELRSPLTVCDQGEALVDSDAGRLVSALRVGGSTLVYLHLAPHDGPGTEALEARLLRAAVRLAGVTPVVEADSDTLVQVFEVAGGRAVVAWDAPAMGRWRWAYEPGLPPMAYAAADVSRALRLPTPTPGDGQAQLVYDLWNDRLTTVPAGAAGVTLDLRGATSGLFYVGSDQPAFRRMLEVAQALRQRCRDLHFGQ